MSHDESCSDHGLAGSCYFECNELCNILYNDASNIWGNDDAMTDTTNDAFYSHCSNATGNVPNDSSNNGGNGDGGGGAGRGEGSGRENNDGISVLYTNARSLVNKINELRVIAANKNPDIIIITETWTNDAIGNDYLHLNGYIIIVRKDRTDTGGGRGGGIIAYV